MEEVIAPSRLFGLAAAALIGLGLFGVVVNPAPLRKILAFNLIGAGTFLLFGVVARRGAAAGYGADPVPQALVITGIVVAFAATAIAVMLVVRLFQTLGAATLADDGAYASQSVGRDGDAPS
jgi:multicomponent Na+:H+ antiporter subunit C